MKRNLSRFARLAAATLLLCALLPLPAGAQEAMPAYEGYLFTFRPELEPMALLSEDEGGLPEGIQALPLGVYRADDLDLLADLVEADWLEVLEPDYVLELMEDGPAVNDPYYTDGRQWNLDNIDMSYAWSNGWTGAGVTVGVVDSGLYQGHEDMDYTAPHMAQGYNAVEENHNIYAATNHGTLVASVIGATTNNGKGVAGIAPGATVMPLQIYGVTTDPDTGAQTTTGGLSSQALAAIKYGVDQGCQVLNMSFGVFTYSNNLKTAVDYALERNVILVASAGNGETGNTGADKYTKIAYPAGYDGVIGVANLGKGGTPAASSQRNASVDVIAPGTGIYGIDVTGADQYQSNSGTSFSSPTVAAVAALCKEADPTLNGESFLALLQANARQPGGTTGRTDEYGYGLLNAADLLRAIVQGQSSLEAVKKSGGVVVTASGLTVDGLAAGRTVLAVTAAYDAEGRMVAADLRTTVAQAHGKLEGWERSWDLYRLPKRVEVLFLDPATWAPLGEPARWTQ